MKPAVGRESGPPPAPEPKMAIREKRTILRSLFCPGSKKFWGLPSDAARVLYVALICNADDEGRLEIDAQTVATFVPRARWNWKKVKILVQNLVAVKLISRYKCGSMECAEIAGFAEAQSWHGLSKEPSKIPQAVQSTGRGGHVPPAATARVVSSSLYIEKKQPQLPTNLTSSFKEEGSGEKIERPLVSSEEAFRTAGRIYRRAVGKSIGPFQPRQIQWQELIKKHGGAVVLKAVEIWAKEGGKRLRELMYPLAVFIKQSQDWIDAADDVVTESLAATANPNGPANLVEFESEKIPAEVRDQILRDRAAAEERTRRRSTEKLNDDELYEHTKKEGF